MFKEEIAKLLAKELKELKTKPEQIKQQLEIPPLELGDYAFPCFQLAKRLKQNPIEIAKSLAAKTRPTKNIEKITAVNGYVNFFIKKELFAQKVVSEILSKKEKFGSSHSGKGERVMIEYSAPNTNKPLHLGHLRNDSIGMAISNILAFTGYKTIKANLLNDRGIHISKVQLAYQKFRLKQQKGEKPDHFIGRLYVEFEKRAKGNEKLADEAKHLLKKWEEKDNATLQTWKKLNELAISGMKETYKKFGSQFDVWFKESEFYDKAQPIINEGLKKNIFERAHTGAIIAKLEPELPNKTILRADGTSIYITNDLALTKHRFEKYKLQRAIWVVASEQNLYFQQLFKIFKLLGFKWADKCKHLSYGLVLLESGKMKSREGTVIDADDLISEIEQLAKKEIQKRIKEGTIEAVSKAEFEKRAEAIALAAIKFYLLKIEPVKDILFVPEKAISFEGETGAYVQYAHTRAASILRKAEKAEKTKTDPWF